MTVRRGPVWPAATFALTALTLVTVVSCKRVFADWSFLGLLLSVALAVHGLMALSRLFNVPLLIATPVTALVTFALIGRDMYPTTMRFSVLPTRATWDAAWLDLRDAWRQFDTASAPVPALGGFLLAAALAIAVAAFAADTFGFRAFGRVEAVIPTGVVYTFVAALGLNDDNVGLDYARIWSGAIWLFTACVAVALLRSAHGDLGNTWLGGRRRERTIRIVGAAGALSLITVALAFAIAPQLPGAGATALIDPGSDAGGSVAVVSPIVSIRSRLVNNSNSVMFRVKADRATYWHLMSNSVFDGNEWKLDDEPFVVANGTLATTGPGRGVEVKQTITIQNMGGQWLPAAMEPAELQTEDDLLYSAGTNTLVMADGARLYGGMTYSITSVVPRFSSAELRGATVASPPDAVYFELPDKFPQNLRDVAAQIVAGAATPFDQALALQNYFRTNFQYSTDVPRGHSDSAIETFLNQKIGYCEQFAGTFAAFGRAVGLPTRVAIGFTQGVPDDEGNFVVRGRNAHAWPEVWFDGLGWVLFEPTPNRGAPDADYTGADPEQDLTVAPDTNTGTGNAQGPDPDASFPTVPRETAPSGNGDPGINGIPIPTVAASATSGPGGGSFPVGLLVGAIIAGAVIAWVALVPRLVARRARRRRGHTPADRVSNAWQEADRALDLIGAGRHESETPLEHAYRAWKLTGIDRDSLRWLANAATRAVYASDTLDEATAHESERIRADVAERVRARATWPTRFRAYLDPRINASLH